MISRCLIVFAVIGVCYAATYQGYLPPKPKEFAHKEGCYVKEINDVIPFGGEATPIGSCIRINCGRSMIYYAGCGTIGTDDSSCYKTEGDLTLPYPQCCPSVKCEEDNRI